MSNRYYVRFHDDHGEGMGSDSLFILDGRNSLMTMVSDAHDRIHKLRFVKKYNGFKIYRSGSRLFDNPKCIYSSIGEAK